MTAKVATAVRMLAFALLPIVLVLSHRNLVLVFVLIAMTGGAALWRQTRARVGVGSSSLPSWSLPFLALAGWLALSSIWTPSRDDVDWAARLPILALLVAGLVAAARGDAGDGRAAKTFAGAVLLSSLLLGIEGVTGGGLRDIFPPENAADRDDVSTARGVGLAVVLLPAGMLLGLRHYGRTTGGLLAALAAICVAIGAGRFHVAANPLALVAAGLAAGAALATPRTAVVALLGGIGAAFLIVPVAAMALPEAAALEQLSEGPLSWRQRLVTWRTIADASLAEPWTLVVGAGQHASAALGERAGDAALPGAPFPLPRVPSHPHNVFLQIWYEGGGVASALAACGFWLSAKRVAAVTAHREVLVASAATLGAVGLLWAVDASIWTLWRGAAVALAGYGLILAANDSQDVVHHSLRR